MKRHALFVGVNDYADPAIRNLRYSIPDASVLADRFRRAGFDTRLLPDPTRQELLEAVEFGTAGLGPGDVFLFFFAGHGFTSQDNAHLLFCRDDRKRMLRVNSAGVRVDALELLTNEGGFHRAFLLDSCRSDAFADEESRGDETRDIGLVAMPEPSDGTFFLLRSCDKFRPSLEIAGLGHGLFTQGVLDAIDAADPALAMCGDAFAGAVRDRMESLARRERVSERQRPVAQINGPGFPLFDPCFFTAGANAVVATPSPNSQLPTPSFVVCHLCRRRRNPLETFLCEGCNHDFCIEHQDETTFLCRDCAAKAKAAEEARIAKERVEAEARRKAEEEARIAKERAEAERDAAEKAARDAELRNLNARPRKVVRVGKVEVAFRWCPSGTSTDDFWMGETQVTQGLWKAIMGENPSCYKFGDDYPVENVSWNDCQIFLKKLNALPEIRNDGVTCRLPSVAEWEYACRAGAAGDYCRLADGTEITEKTLGEVAWYHANSGGATHPVGQKKPNAFGLYDMLGNVWEWTSSTDVRYRDSFLVNCGGSLTCAAKGCEVGFRMRDLPDHRIYFLGFRLAASGWATEAQRKAAEDAKNATAKAEAEAVKKPNHLGIVWPRRFGILGADKAAREEERNRPAGTRKIIRIGKIEVAFRWCPPGTFTMGSPTSEEGHQVCEKQHGVTLTKGFWMGETQVTQELWMAIMGENPSRYKSGDNYPVEGVSWNDCQKFLKALNSRFPVDGYRFALPTEAQWEYACRAGTTGAYGGNGRLGDMGWCHGNATHPVAQKLPNAWGLYDMHGNVWEWCADRSGGYPSGDVTDPTGPASGDNRVLRGGDYEYGALGCRSANRDGGSPYYCSDCGLRLLALQDAP